MEVAYQLYAILLAVNDCDPEIVKVIVPEALKDIAKKKGEEEHAENRQPA